MPTPPPPTPVKTPDLVQEAGEGYVVGVAAGGFCSKLNKLGKKKKRKELKEHIKINSNAYDHNQRCHSQHIISY
jgi:hypothetical protein